MRTKYIKESINFKRGINPKESLSIGTRSIIKDWFKEFAPDIKYEIDDDLNIFVDKYLYLENTNISSLPNNLTIWGSLDLENTNISSLPDNLNIKGYLNLMGTNITSLPDDLTVGWKIYKDF